MARFLQDIAAVLDPLMREEPSARESIKNIEPIEAVLIPEPYRSLLVHDSDMTPTLSAWWGLPIALRPLIVFRDGDLLHRQVVLTAGPGRIPVEAGAIRIHLDRFPPEALPVILRGRQPLGAVLSEYRIAHVSDPQGFFRLPANRFLKEAFQDPRDQTLYGRCNRLSDAAGKTLAEVVEILPATVRSSFS